MNHMEQKEEENTLRWKCYNCYLVIKDEDLIDGKCPVCGDDSMLQTMCRLDTIDSPAHDVEGGTWACPECGRPCASNLNHNVSVTSRITGYLSEIYSDNPFNDPKDKYSGSAWNLGKYSEWRNRKRENNVENEKV